MKRTKFSSQTYVFALAAFMLFGCQSRPPVASPCLKRLVERSQGPDMAISPDGRRAVMWRTINRAPFQSITDMAVIDTRTGDILMTRELADNLHWYRDEVYMRDKDAIVAWNPDRNAVRKLYACRCDYDISARGVVALVRDRGLQNTLELAVGFGAEPYLSIPTERIRAPGFSPDGGHVAVQSLSGLMVFDVTTGTGMSIDGNFAITAAPVWFSNSELLVVKLRSGRVERLDVASGTVSTFLDVPLDGLPPNERSVDGLAANEDFSILLVMTGARDVYAVNVACVRATQGGAIDKPISKLAALHSVGVPRTQASDNDEFPE